MIDFQENHITEQKEILKETLTQNTNSFNMIDLQERNGMNERIEKV